MYSRLRLRFLLSSMCRSGRAEPMIGSGWSGCVMSGAGIQGTEAIALIDEVCADVRAQMHADGVNSRDRYRPVSVVCAAQSAGVEKVIDELGLARTHNTSWCAGARFAGGARLAIVATDPDRQITRRVIAHEVCHALCDRANRSRPALSWLLEGYAALIEAAACPHSHELRVARLLNLVSARPGAAMQQIAELVEDPAAPIGADPAGYWQSLSALFVEFIRSIRRTEGAAWEIVRRSLDGARGAVTGPAIEKAMRCSRSEIAEQFADYCVAELRRLYAVVDTAAWDLRPVRTARPTIGQTYGREN